MMAGDREVNDKGSIALKTLNTGSLYNGDAFVPINSASQTAFNTCTADPHDHDSTLFGTASISKTPTVILALECIRDYVRVFLGHPWLTFPLGGALVAEWFIDMNILEAIVSSAFMYLVLGWEYASETSWAFGTAIVVAFLLACVPRNSIWVYLLGIPFERMIKYHRWASTFLVVPLVLHAVGNSGFEACTEDNPYDCFWGDDDHKTGAVIFISYGVMFLTALPTIRRRLFETFYFTHFMFISFIVATVLHKPDDLYVYVLPPLGLYVVDRALRFQLSWYFSGRVHSATALPGGVTKVAVDARWMHHLNYRAGQYVFVYFPEVSSIQWHPFSIATIPTDPLVSIYIRAQNKGQFTSLVSESVHKGSKIRCEGGYGSPSVPLYLMDAVVLVGGGVGVVPLVSILRELSLPFPTFRSRYFTRRTSRVVLIWSVKSASELIWFATELSQAKKMARQSGITVELKYFVTRPGKTDQDAMAKIYSGEGSEAEVLFQRPDLYALLSQEANQGWIGVHTCGPRPMVASTTSACVRLSGTKCTFFPGSETFEL